MTDKKKKAPKVNYKYTRPRIMLHYSGLFDFDGMYAAIISWAKHYGFQWFEVDYKHKVPSPYGAEQEFKWKMSKNVTAFLQYEINFTVHIWDMKEVEVEMDGKKKSLVNGRMRMWIDATVNHDWQKQFQNKSPFIVRLGEWYRHVLYKKDIESIYYDQLYYRTWDLHNIIKKYLDMQTTKYAYKGYLKEN